MRKHTKRPALLQATQADRRRVGIVIPINDKVLLNIFASGESCKYIFFILGGGDWVRRRFQRAKIRFNSITHN